MITLELASSYVGVPYEEMDCFELCKKVLSEALNYDVPDPIRDSLKQTPEWVLATEADALIILFKTTSVRRHLGLKITDQLMLHTQRGVGSCIERWKSPRWEKRVLSLWKLDNSLIYQAPFKQ